VSQHLAQSTIRAKYQQSSGIIVQSTVNAKVWSAQRVWHEIKHRHLPLVVLRLFASLGHFLFVGRQRADTPTLMQHK
jgi:hypothetical protein